MRKGYSWGVTKKKKGWLWKGEEEKREKFFVGDFWNKKMENKNKKSISPNNNKKLNENRKKKKKNLGLE